MKGTYFMKKLTSFLFSCVLLFGLHGEVFADTANTFPYKVTPDFNKNQNPNTASYFDLTTKPGTRENVSVKIQNVTDKPITVHITPANALTADNGGIFYAQKKVAGNSVLYDELFALESFIDIGKEKVELEAKEMKEIKLSINVPDVPEGNIAGALIFSYEDGDNQKTYNNDEKTATFSLKPEYQYVMGIKLNLGKDAETKFSFGKVESAFYPSGFKMLIGMKNDSSKIVIVDRVKYEVLNNKDELVFEGQLDSVKMAPKTQIGFPVNWKSPSFEQKKYKVRLTSLIGDKEQTETTTLVIEGQSGEVKIETEEFFKNPLDNMRNDNYLLVSVIVILLVIIVWLSVFVWRTKRKVVQEVSEVKTNKD